MLSTGGSCGKARVSTTGTNLVGATGSSRKGWMWAGSERGVSLSFEPAPNPIGSTPRGTLSLTRLRPEALQHCWLSALDKL